MSAVQRLGYFIASLLLLSSQHLAAWLVPGGSPDLMQQDAEFWFTPLASGLGSSGLPEYAAYALLAWSLVIAWTVAWLSFRVAARINTGNAFAALSVVPVVQIIAIVVLTIIPRQEPAEGYGRPPASSGRQVVQGPLAGVAIVVLAVLVSAVSFGAYGWGLFVATPFLVGLTTGYLVNRDEEQGVGRTMKLCLAAAGLGSLALVALALEGIVCILMAAPLAIPFVMLGGAAGRGLAVSQHDRGQPFYSIAILPLVFLAEGAMPPQVPIATHHSIEIDAPPEAVWDALISAEPVAAAPGLPGLAGLAYPVRGRIAGEGVGARRIGVFSTGDAVEEVTLWRTGRALAFRVIEHPPAMEEMSPYRRVHAPHLEGYFLTGETRFDLVPMPSGGTRITIASEHILRIDPIPYWEPIARLAIRDNVNRVLRDIKAKAERRTYREQAAS